MGCAASGCASGAGTAGGPAATAAATTTGRRAPTVCANLGLAAG
jgi:hypothetical protein